MARKPAAARLLSPAEIAKRVGATPQLIRRKCGDRKKPAMPGAEWDGRRWRIDPEQALPWLLNEERSPRLANRQPLELPELPASAPPPAAADEIEELIRDTRMLVQVLHVALRKGGFDARLFRSLKEQSSELRALVKQRTEERERDGRLIDLEHHQVVVKTLARMVDQEAAGLPRSLPDAIITALTEGGWELESPAEALQVVAAAVEAEAGAFIDRLREHVANARHRKAGEANG